MFSEWNMESYFILSPGFAWICRRKNPLEFRSHSSEGMMIKHHKLLLDGVYLQLSDFISAV